jgi:protein-tyrosine phosphatase
MNDLHSHILHGIDDGAATFEETLAMARMDAGAGTRVLAATPHSPTSTASRHYDPASIREQVAALNAALAAEGTAIEIVAGTEICYDGDLVRQLQRGQLLPYGTSRAILLELPHEPLPPMLGQMLFALQLAGFQVMLEHPERFGAVQRNPNVLLPLIERGVLMQLTGQALTGNQGERLRTTAETLVTHGMIHVIASDTHGLPPRRPPLLADARARAAELLGPTAAEALVRTIPAAILGGKPLQIPPARPVEQTRRWWRR